MSRGSARTCSGVEFQNKYEWEAASCSRRKCTPMCETTKKVKSRQHLVKFFPKKPGVVPLGLECSIHVQRCAVDIWVDLMYSFRDILVNMLCASVQSDTISQLLDA